MSLPSTLVVPGNLGAKTSVVELDADGQVVTELSYEQLQKASSGLLDGLKPPNKLQKGDTAVLFMPNGAEFVVVALGLLQQGVVVSPLNPALKPGQVTDFLNRIKPAAVIGTEENVQMLHTAAGGQAMVLRCPKLHHKPAGHGDIGLENFVLSLYPDANGTSPASTEADGNAATITLSPDDPAILLFTSGTTGAPKGALLTHRNVLTSAEIISEAHQLTERDICLLVTPLYHVAGLCSSLLLTMVTGGTLVVLPPGVPSSGFWRHVLRHRVTWFHAVPTILKYLIKFDGVKECKDAPDNSLRFLRCSGSPLTQDLLEETEAVTGKPLLDVYGLTESSPGIFCNRLESTRIRQAGTFPIPRQLQLKIVAPTEPAGSLANLSLEPSNGVEVAKPEVGELCIRGPSVITQYLYTDGVSNAEAFDADGFFRTGDLVRRLDGGFLQLRGRVKESINKGGAKINPAEVDQAILAHADVAEVACFAARDEEFGEDICAAIVLKPGRDVSTLKLQQTFRKELRRLLRQKLAGFQIPRDIHFTDSLPKTALGKYKRREIAERYGEVGTSGFPN